MEIKHRVQSQTAIITLTGEFAGKDSEFFLNYLEPFFSKNGVRKVLIDCRRLTFISASGIQDFSTSHCKLEEYGKGIMLCGMDPNVEELVEVIGVPHSLKRFRTQKEALECVKKMVTVQVVSGR